MKCHGVKLAHQDIVSYLSKSFVKWDSCTASLHDTLVPCRRAPRSGGRQPRPSQTGCLRCGRCPAVSPGSGAWTSGAFDTKTQSKRADVNTHTGQNEKKRQDITIERLFSHILNPYLHGKA